MSQSIRRVCGAVIVGLGSVALACAPLPAAEGVAESYGDCILAHVESGMDQAVINSVRSACRDKFPANAVEVDAAAQVLEDDAVSRLAFRRAGGNASSLYGVLYNGNPDVTLTEVDIAVTTMINGAEESHVYRARETVPPLGTATIQLTVLPGDRAAPESATVTAARGRPAQ